MEGLPPKKIERERERERERDRGCAHMRDENQVTSSFWLNKAYAFR